ncbi:MAG: efflux RND transporter periplasmic adaptor subunit [bacterium]
MHNETGSGGIAQTGSDRVEVWTCSMHPQIRQPNPGKCPLCGMDLIPLETDSGTDAHPRKLEMSESARKLAEIQTVPVIRGYAEHELRMVGKVEYDESRVKSITAWFPGRLDRLYVDYTGTPVRKGDHLVEIYSPSLITDQEALIQVVKAAQSGSSVTSISANRKQLLNNARNRLRLLGLTDEQIQEIEQRGTPFERITFYSPIDGIVILKEAVEGDYVDTGSRIYTIADLSHVWIKVDAYESDLQWVHYGQRMQFTTEAYPGEVFDGRIAFIDPYLNEETRTVKVRVNVENPAGKLKPGMFVHAIVSAQVTEAGMVFDPELGGKWICPMHPEVVKDEASMCDICGMSLVSAESQGFVNPRTEKPQPPLLIPASAPLITGKRAVVYVMIPDTDKPAFEGREIVLGPRVGDQYVVEQGLLEGEQVVTRGNFKIDSALQIQARPSMMNSTDHAGAVEEHTSEYQLNRKSNVPQPAVADLLAVYQTLWKALAEDDLAESQQASHSWVRAAEQHELNDLAALGHKIMHSENLDNAREAFYRISESMIAAIEAHGAPADELYLAYCPMAFDNQGAHWLQWDESILNPYFGSSMLTCGEIQKTLHAKD